MTLNPKFLLLIFLSIQVQSLRGQHICPLKSAVHVEMQMLNVPLDTTALFKQIEHWKEQFKIQNPNTANITIADVTRFIFSDLGITAARDAVRMSALIQDKKGNCVTIALLYFTLTKDTPWQFHVVHAPEHFFLRSHTDSMSSTNIEPTQQGMELSDSFYIRTKNISDESIQMGCYMAERDISYLEDAYLNNMGVLLQAAGKYEAAIGIYTASINRFPVNPEIMVNRGDCYRSLNQFELAIKDYTGAIELYHLDIRYFSRRGVAYVNAGECQLAIDDFTQVLQQQIEDVPMLVNRGKAYFNCDDIPLACQDWRNAMIAGDAEADILLKRHCKK